MMTGPGVHKCQCMKGHAGNPQTLCEAVNPCKAVKPPCDVNAVCQMTTPGKHTCTCNNGFTGNGFSCRQTDVVVKWVDGPQGSKTPIVSYPPSHPQFGQKAGTPVVGAVTMTAAGTIVPAGAAGANPNTGVAPGTPAGSSLQSAVSDVLKVITSKLDDSDLRQSLGAQKVQDSNIAAVNTRLSKLENNTRQLIKTTTKQTATLKGMLGYDEFNAAPAPAPAPTAAAAATPAAAAAATPKALDSAAAKIADLKAAVKALKKA